MTVKGPDDGNGSTRSEGLTIGRILSQWPVVVGLGAAAAFILERARLHGYSSYYVVPSEFTDIDPRLAYETVLGAVAQVALALFLILAITTYLQRRRWVGAQDGDDGSELDRSSSDPKRGKRRVSFPTGSRGSIIRFVAILLAVSSLLLGMGELGDDLGKSTAASRTNFFVVGEPEGLRATIVLFFRGDLMLVRDVCRNAEDELWKMQLSFRIVPVVEAASLERRDFGPVVVPPPVGPAGGPPPCGDSG